MMFLALVFNYRPKLKEAERKLQETKPVEDARVALKLLKEQADKVRKENEQYLTRNKEYKKIYSEYEEDAKAKAEVTYKEKLDSLMSELDKKKREEYRNLHNQRKQLTEDVVTLREKVSTRTQELLELEKQCKTFTETLEMVEVGLYEPVFDFDSSERYRAEIGDNREKQKSLIKTVGEKGAIYCPLEWQVAGSKAEGKKMVARASKLALRAFNGECDGAIANCRWNNVSKMEARINKAFRDINAMNESHRIILTNAYLALKLEELYLTHEYHEQRQKEKEEQAEIRRRMSDEAKLEAEIRKAQAAAEREEAQYERALAKAREEAAQATGVHLSVLNDKIAELSRQLAEAEERKERAKSMAEQTRQGFVYVISNIGSFGENVYKIGMTRRLDPYDRVKELSSASVPFEFDCHAMIFSEDAPALEKMLHRELDSKRVNKVNNRKEFFSVSLDEIKHAVTVNYPNEVEFIETAVARSFRESQAVIS